VPNVTADILYRLANIVLGVSALSIAALIVAAIRRRPARKLEPLGLVFCLVFLAIGLRAAVRVWASAAPETPQSIPAMVIAVDWVAAAAALGFLLLHRRYAMFIESVDMVREYETGYAQKDREAKALAQVNEELRRLDELKSEFLAMVSHELRTPLTAIIGYSRLLSRQVHGTLTPKQLEHQDAIFRSAQRLTDLINDLLDVSRLEAGRVELQPRPTDLRQAVDQVITVIAVAAHAKQLRLANALPPDLPAVTADPGRLQQILVYLVGNAVKFSSAGGSVTVRGGRHRDQVWVTVEDIGVGVAKENLARIWDPFYQVEAPMRRRHGGSGLGLAIVRRLVELHGGVVRAESEGVNLGSRFTFTLPVAAEPVPREAFAPEPVTAVFERMLAGRVVLIVEDEKQNQELMRSVIEDILGGQARVCDDGEQCLFEAAEHPPALILLDLMLPGLSGWEVARRLRQSPRTSSVPIIAVSALSRPQEREAALHAGCDAYLAKPFTLEDMARLITATLETQGVGAR
jgi:signal transduction histidine kinase/ActR/RegA family two-component response regulator